MNNPHQLENIPVDCAEKLQNLAWAINTSKGEFTLFLARCNYTNLRSQLLENLQLCCGLQIRVIVLDESATVLYTLIRDKLGQEQPDCLTVCGLESVRELESLLAATNQVREEFRKNFPFPLVLWVNDEILTKMIRLIPDFENWSTSRTFDPATFARQPVCP